MGFLDKAGEFVLGLEEETEAATRAGEEFAEKYDMATGDTAADAVRHMTMAAMTVREYPTIGEGIMAVKEMLDGGDQRATRMDKHNNEMGIKAFLELPEEYRDSMSNEEIAEYMKGIVQKEYDYRIGNEGKPSGEGPKFYERPLATDYNEGGAVTSAGRKVFKDEDGENYSEKTITFETSEGWVTIPTVDSEGNQYTQEQLEEFVAENGPVDPLTGKTLPVFETVEEAVEYGKTRSSELGEEMRAAPAGMGKIEKFNEGGLMDEPNIDPVSGNEIPPGSTAENVRDDIPAMLSEGEFVLPADVVKWHGLEKIMDMRSQAKAGLMAMECEGQIKAPTEEVEEHPHHEEVEMEASDEGTDENGNEEYPTDMGQFEYGDEQLLVLMAADGGEVTSGDTKPVTRLVRKLVRDPATGKMKIMFVDLATGQPVATKSVQEGMADGTMETVDQSPERMFSEIQTASGQEKTTAEEVVDEAGSVTSSDSGSGDSGEGTGNSAPIERTLANNYGFTDGTGRTIATGFGSLIPGGSVLANWAVNANNTDAVNAARADLGLDPLDTTLGVNLDAATGLVTDQADTSDDIDVGPWAADVTMMPQYGKLERDVADLDKSSIGTQLSNSKAGRFFSGDTPSTETWRSGDGYASVAGLPYKTSSTLTPSEIAEKKAAGLNYQDGRWGYSQAAENIGLGTFSEMTQDEYGSSSIAKDFADEYGLTVATDRGRQEAMGLLSQDMEFFDEDGDGKLSAAEEREMQDFYGSDDTSSSNNSGGQSSMPDYSSDTGGGVSGNGSDPGDGGGAISSTADGNDWDSFGSDDDDMSFGSGGWDTVFNKGGYAIKKKQKYATIKK